MEIKGAIKMNDLINKITLDFEPLKGHELIKILEQKKENYTIQTLLDDIQKAINILNSDCFTHLKRSRKYWNKIINQYI